MAKYDKAITKFLGPKDIWEVFSAGQGEDRDLTMVVPFLARNCNSDPMIWIRSWIIVGAILWKSRRNLQESSSSRKKIRSGCEKPTNPYQSKIENLV